LVYGGKKRVSGKFKKSAIEGCAGLLLPLSKCGVETRPSSKVIIDFTA
jgi:hypothetical protein